MSDATRCTNDPAHSAPFLIVHLDVHLPRMMVEILVLEGYQARATSSGGMALAILRSAKQGLIVYVEPLLLEVRGNERLRDYVLGRGSDDPHVFMLLAAFVNIQAQREALRPDGALQIPFTMPQLLASVEEAQHLPHTKQA